MALLKLLMTCQRIAVRWVGTNQLVEWTERRKLLRRVLPLHRQEHLSGSLLLAGMTHSDVFIIFTGVGQLPRAVVL